MTKTAKDNPYAFGTPKAQAWHNGFEAGQESTLAPVLVTGRWWQAKNGEIFFIYPGQYVIYERISEDNPDNSRWLTEELTIES